VALGFIRTEVAKTFGPAVLADLIASHVTQWGNDAFARGAFAAIDPKRAPNPKARQVLQTSINDHLFFAGEASHPDEWATVFGAHKAGLRVGQLLANAN